MLNEKEYIEKLKSKYEIKDNESKLDKLKKLDKKVYIKPRVFSYIFGSISSLVLGFGMCLGMKVLFEELFVLGIVIGLIGILLCSINYPLYKLMVKNSKEKYREEILDLSNELLQSEV